jgi:metal-responsive CopG/Arc/MetJ family transcriptional regulator
MGSNRAHIVIPQDLIEQIDALVGPRGRSAFLVETARAELRKRALIAFLENDEPVMKDEDHPELAAMGTVAWVKKMREGWAFRGLELQEHEPDK